PRNTSIITGTVRYRRKVPREAVSPSRSHRAYAVAPIASAYAAIEAGGNRQPLSVRNSWPINGSNRSTAVGTRTSPTTGSTPRIQRSAANIARPRAAIATQTRSLTVRVRRSDTAATPRNAAPATRRTRSSSDTTRNNIQTESICIRGKNAGADLIDEVQRRKGVIDNGGKRDPMETTRGGRAARRASGAEGGRGRSL